MLRGAGSNACAIGFAISLQRAGRYDGFLCRPKHVPMNHHRPRQRTMVITTREAALLVGALAVLSVAVALFLIGLRQFGLQRALPRTLATATPLSSAHTGEAASLLPSGITATAVLAPTLAPTPVVIQHVVQPGESLTSIAILYEVDLEALLDANGLTPDSIIQPGQVLTIPLVPGNEGAYHEVRANETLSSIAGLYGVAAEIIQRANNLPDADSIYVGQRLFIPGVPARTALPAPSQPVPTATPTSALYADLLQNGPQISGWPRSILQGDLNKNYPLVYEARRFRMHYQPDTYPANHVEETVALIENGLAQAESALGVRLAGTFDVYVAGTLFDIPNTALRGLSLSAERQVFVLHDGSGNAIDAAYFFAHEITHLVAWNTWGQPSSTMLSEGLATYVGRPILEAGGFLPYDQICLAVFQAGLMPSMAAINTDFQAFKGHIRDPFNYFSSACFVGWLIEQYGLEPMSRVYHTSDYVNLYGMSLSTLDSDWRVSLGAQRIAPTLDAQAFAEREQSVSQAYAYVFGNYNGSEVMHLAYAMVDRARVALWQGRLADVDRWLTEFTTLTGFTP